MKYQAKLTDIDGDVVYLNFVADTNELASDHIAHCSSDKDIMGRMFDDIGLSYRKIVRADFRRHYAEHWINSVKLIS